MKDIKNCFWHSIRTSCFGELKDCCGRYMPDSLRDCEGVCEYYEPKNEQLHLDYGDVVALPLPRNEEPCKVVIEGVGKDAEIVVNENGGKQSKTPMSMHLIDPVFLFMFAVSGQPKLQQAMEHIASFEQTGESTHLIKAIHYIEPENAQVLIRIATVMKDGEDRYEPNNWRLIPQEIHINHALIHLLAAYLGDTQDAHLDHALCRLMMAYATETSENFSYTEYKKKAS